MFILDYDKQLVSNCITDVQCYKFDNADMLINIRPVSDTHAVIQMVNKHITQDNPWTQAIFYYDRSTARIFDVSFDGYPV